MELCKNLVRQLYEWTFIKCNNITIMEKSWTGNGQLWLVPLKVILFESFKCFKKIIEWVSPQIGVKAVLQRSLARFCELLKTDIVIRMCLTLNRVSWVKWKMSAETVIVYDNVAEMLTFKGELHSQNLKIINSFLKK